MLVVANVELAKVVEETRLELAIVVVETRLEDTWLCEPLLLGVLLGRSMYAAVEPIIMTITTTTMAKKRILEIVIVVRLILFEWIPTKKECAKCESVAL